MDLLSQIINRKRERVEEAQCEIPLEQIRDEAYVMRERAASHALRRALQRDGINVIAEFKRRSPSKGVIRAGADVAKGGLLRRFVGGFRGGQGGSGSACVT